MFSLGTRHVLELDVHVAVRRMIVSIDRQGAQDLDALGAGGNQDLRVHAMAAAWRDRC